MNTTGITIGLANIGCAIAAIYPSLRGVLDEAISTGMLPDSCLRNRVKLNLWKLPATSPHPACVKI
jgi:hypothetical protein